MESKIREMLTLQKEINAVTDPEGKGVGNYHRSIWTEMAEMVDHYGWKWWKKQEPDLDQVHMELVDILHFGLSIELAEKESGVETIHFGLRNPCVVLGDEIYETGELAKGERGDFLRTTDETVSLVISEETLDWSLFAGLMHISGLSFEDMYRKYIGKNVLNRFRQNHGYRHGSYRKSWSLLDPETGKVVLWEDNQVLTFILERLPGDGSSIQDFIYSSLEKYYPA